MTVYKRLLHDYGCYHQFKYQHWTVCLAVCIARPSVPEGHH